MNQENLQAEVNRLVNRGIVFGIIWILGIGSAIAIISGYQANKLIRSNGINSDSSKKVIQCYLLGTAGLLVWIIAIIIIIFFRKK